MSCKAVDISKGEVIVKQLRKIAGCVSEVLIIPVLFVFLVSAYHQSFLWMWAATGGMFIVCAAKVIEPRG